MRQALLKLGILRCPVCAREGKDVPLTLALAPTERSGDDILKGRLAGTGCRHGYPIAAGVLQVDPAPAGPDEYYDSAEGLEHYLGLHFPSGAPLDPLAPYLAPTIPPPYPVGPARLVPPEAEDERALDLGAACGRLTMELAHGRAFSIGVDRSATLIRAGREVLRSGVATYRRTVEGSISEPIEVRLPVPDHVELIVGDARATPFSNDSFDLVATLNLLDRLDDPAALLDEAARLVRPGGRLLVASPFTWLERYTPRARWLGGFEEAGRPVRGADGVRERLSGFALEVEAYFPFFIRHHALSGQLGFTHAMLFRRG